MEPPARSRRPARPAHPARLPPWLPAWLRARPARPAWLPAWVPPGRDVALAVGVAAVQVGAALAINGQGVDPGRRPLDAVGAALPVASGLALVARRRFPAATFAVALAATATYLHMRYTPAPVFWALVVAFVTTMLQGRRRAAVAELAGGYAVVVTLMTVDHGFDAAVAGALAAWLIVLLTGSELVRARRDRAREQVRWREEEARRRVTEERLRIARELHDVVAHNISLVNLQAGVALHLLDQQPDQARTALATIKDASKEALVELRSVLGVLRQVDEDDDGAPRAPTPGLARLDDLVAQSVAAGVDVRVVREGPARPLPAGLDLAAFRIVQEALTNVARHAGPTAATVRLAFGDAALAIEVTDDGRRAGARAAAPDASLGSGHGLAGMRERAEAVGGALTAGPRPGFGWQVRAHLPYAAPGAPLAPADPREGADPGPDPEPAADPGSGPPPGRGPGAVSSTTGGRA